MTHPRDPQVGPPGHLRTTLYPVWKQRGQFLNLKTTNKVSSGITSEQLNTQSY